MPIFLISILDFLNNHTPLLYLTQSLWRDEAYSVLLSQHSAVDIIRLTTQDFNPPFYYLLLHFWMQLFGTSEIAVRMLSFLFHLGLVYVCYLFAKKLKFSRLSTFYFLLSTFLNPMLIYYGFEARMYSLLALLATASMYFFYTKNRLGYIISTALGLWTQPFMIFIPLCQAAFLIFTKKFSRFYFFNFLFSFLIFLPWIPTLLSQFLRSSSSWLWPINSTTIMSILGNLLTGYEGTPGGLWSLMGILSLIILSFSFFLLRHVKSTSCHSEASACHPERSEGSPSEGDSSPSAQNDNRSIPDDKKFIRLLLCWLFLPVVLVLTISVFKPIYVNRYLIFVNVAEVFLIITALSLIKNSPVRFLLSTFYLLLTTGLLFFSVSFHQKQNIRQTMNEINYLAKPNDIILTQTPLTIFETKYYSRDENQVFLYNPERRVILDYVGKNLIDEMKQVAGFPFYPKRAFLIHEDASYEMVYQK